MASQTGVHHSEIISEWDRIRDNSSDHGDYIHKQMEDGWKLGKTPDRQWQITFEEIQTLVSPYKRVFPEKKLFIDKYRLAGMADLPTERYRGKDMQIIDLFDYKTNMSKGITLYKSYINKYGKWVHKMDFMLDPISHLEASLFNKYSLQLSMYAYMIEHNYSAKIGRMGILFIDLNKKVNIMPIPYMRMEAELLLSTYASLKKIA